MTSFCGCAIVSGDLENRVGRLENRDIVLEKKLSESEARLAVQDDETKEKLLASIAQLNADIDAIMEKVRILTGRIEVVEHQIEKEIQADSARSGERVEYLMALEESMQANEERIIRIEQYLDMEASKAAKLEETSTMSKSQAPSPLPASAKTDEGPTDNDLYKSAKAEYDNGRYDVAMEKFKDLIQKFPNSENADNAQFWIGEIYFHQEMYDNAIMEYENVIKNYPEGNKVPAAYLKQGLTFYNINDENTARILLEKLISDYPDSNEAKIARDKLKTFK